MPGAFVASHPAKRSTAPRSGVAARNALAFDVVGPAPGSSDLAGVFVFVFVFATTFAVAVSVFGFALGFAALAFDLAVAVFGVALASVVVGPGPRFDVVVFALGFFAAVVFFLDAIGFSAESPVRRLGAHDSAVWRGADRVGFQPMKAVTSLSAPSAIGPYSQAIDAGDFVFLSGQVPIDPKTGELVTGDISVQTDRVLDNLGAVLEAAGCSFADVVKTTIYLMDLGDFQAVNATYAKRFAEAAPPARATVQVSALPKGARVEIDAIAKKRA